MQKVHLVPHTHWDREWYKPFQHFRVRLVYAIDKILSILENDPDFTAFLLDGQTIVLEDYLQIKPENRERLERLIAANRLAVGPWYIQPDEFAPDGESLVRNLLLGKQIADTFGRTMLVGYLPDSFGHTGQLPQILKGFGINSAVLMRGVDAGRIQSTEFNWTGINGDQVLAVYLPHGYSNGMFLPEDYRMNRLRLRLMVRMMRKWVSTNNTLILNGVDHQFPQAHIPAHLDRLNNTEKKYDYQVSTIEDYIQAVRDEDPDLPELDGELIIPARNRVHLTMASTRIPQKQKNREMERLLERYVEPITTMAWLYNAEYPDGLINQAWKILLQNQTHDGICGCCLDEVHQEMDQRFVDIRNIGESLQNAYARAIARQASPNAIDLIVFNNAMTRGKQRVKATLYTASKSITLLDDEGNSIPFQVLSSEKANLSEKTIWTLYLKGKEIVNQIEITFIADFDFNFGYKYYRVKDKGLADQTESKIRIDGNIIENGLVRVEINRDGSINLHDLVSDQAWPNLHTFEDCGDAGDTYNFSPVQKDTVASSSGKMADFKIIRSGPLSAEVLLNYSFEVPIGLVNDDTERSENTVSVPISSRLWIHANDPIIEFKTTVDNQSRDHRLRILFPTAINTDYSLAETQFGVVRRPTEIDNKNWKKEKWHEKPLPIYPQQRFAAINDQDKGLTILNRGIPEYEIYTDGGATLAVTLIRGVGMMGKPDLAIRPGRPSGIVEPTPDAQCLGIHDFEYAILIQSGEIQTPEISKAAAEFDARPLAVQTNLPYKKTRRRYGFLEKLISLETLTSHIQAQLTNPPQTDLALLTLSDDRMQISAIKKAERDNSLILRFFNPGTETISDGFVEVNFNTIAGFLTDLNEDHLTDLKNPEPGVFLLPEVTANSAVTIKLMIQSKG